VLSVLHLHLEPETFEMLNDVKSVVLTHSNVMLLFLIVSSVKPL